MPSSSRMMVWDLNDYWLSLPEVVDALGYDEETAEYKPFWPIQEEPESTEPFIVYDNYTTVSPRDWWMWTDVVVYEVYSKDLIAVAKLINAMINYGKAGAENAWLINDWASANNRTDYKFKSIELIEVGDGAPSIEEYGVRNKYISFQVKYIPNLGLGVDGSEPETAPAVPQYYSGYNGGY